MEFLSRRKNLTAIAYLLGGAGLAVAQNQVDGGQPEMQGALEHLRQANQNLEKAKHDKGGHAERAHQLVEQAIGEVKAGIEYAIHHH